MNSFQTANKLIVGIGNPVIDIVGETDQETLDKFGLQFGKTGIISDKNYPFFETLENNSNKVTYSPGGSVLNSIKVAGWILKNKKLSYSCSFIGSIGKDSYGQIIIDSLRNSNVETNLLEELPKAKSSRCSVGVLNKERCLLPQMRASALISLNFLQLKIEEIKKAEMLFIEGYLVINKFELCEFLAKLFALQMEKKVIFTLSANFLMEKFYAKMIQISDLSSLIFCNAEEAVALSRLTPVSNPSIEEIAKAMHLNLTPKERLIVITRGRSPVFISKFDYAENKLKDVLTFDVIEVADEEIKDTNGCGDAFAGAFSVKYLLGETIENCAKAGLYSSSLVLRNIGCNFDFTLEYK